MHKTQDQVADDWAGKNRSIRAKQHGQGRSENTRANQVEVAKQSSSGRRIAGALKQKVGNGFFRSAVGERAKWPWN